MIIYTPLDLPKIEPDNWDVFWDIWDRNAQPLVKVGRNASTSTAPIGCKSIWLGFDIIKKNFGHTAWEAPFYDISAELPNFFTSIQDLDFPLMYRARLLMSVRDINAHTDDDKDVWHTRSFIHYTSDKPQWYFTLPGDPKGPRTYIDMPTDTNWFAYNDKHCWHGTDFDANNKKILLQIYCDMTPDDLIKRSQEKYKDYTISYD